MTETRDSQQTVEMEIWKGEVNPLITQKVCFMSMISPKQSSFKGPVGSWLPDTSPTQNSPLQGAMKLQTPRQCSVTVITDTVPRQSLERFGNQSQARIPLLNQLEGGALCQFCGREIY